MNCPRATSASQSVLPPCVDGSELARTFFTYAGLVGTAHVFGLLRGSHDRIPGFNSGRGLQYLAHVPPPIGPHSVHKRARNSLKTKQRASKPARTPAQRDPSAGASGIPRLPTASTSPPGPDGRRGPGFGVSAQEPRSRVPVNRRHSASSGSGATEIASESFLQLREQGVRARLSTSHVALGPVSRSPPAGIAGHLGLRCLPLRRM